jgi:hypothetical protein
MNARKGRNLVGVAEISPYFPRVAEYGNPGLRYATALRLGNATALAVVATALRL